MRAEYNKDMQFQVPQFIETEDKIVGPLSIRQFIYVGVGVGISGLLYFILQTWLWAILSFIVVGGALAIAFVKIQGRPLTAVIASAFNFYWNPQTYVWQPEHPRLGSLKAPKEGRDRLTAKKEEAKPKEKVALEAPEEERKGFLEKIAEGLALHKVWEDVQTGEKISDKQFTEDRMYGRYQIFQKLTGERHAARRVDYR